MLHRNPAPPLYEEEKDDSGFVSAHQAAVHSDPSGEPSSDPAHIVGTSNGGTPGEQHPDHNFHSSSGNHEGHSGQHHHDTTAQNIPPQADAIIQETLDVHNELRARHGVPPLEWAEECYHTAKIWAEKCAQNMRLDRGGQDDDTGQNVAWSSGSMTVTQAISRWYRESTRMKFKHNPPAYVADGFETSTAQFTQLIWASTSHVGLARVENSSGTYIICNYGPAGTLFVAEFFC